ncbi:MAG: hypothetical protein LBI35_05230 [Burkholderiales bacterium]|jgi:hypothetical protein|nr:hypothetical protein [Burkholderiales bacterium]
MNVLEKIIAAYAEPPVTATFDPEGIPMEVRIRKVTLLDQEAIEAVVDKKHPDKDDPKRGMAMTVEIFRRALLDDDGAQAIKNDRDVTKLKEAIGVKRGMEFIGFVAAKSMGFEDPAAGEAKKE